MAEYNIAWSNVATINADYFPTVYAENPDVYYALKKTI